MFDAWVAPTTLPKNAPASSLYAPRKLRIGLSWRSTGSDAPRRRAPAPTSSPAAQAAARPDAARSFRAFMTECNAFARHLLGRGVLPHDRVAVMATNRPELLVEVQMPKGTAIGRTSEAAREVETWLRTEVRELGRARVGL